MTSSVDLDSIMRDVDNRNTAEQKINTFLNGLSSYIAAVKNQPQTLQVLSENLQHRKDSILHAFTSNPQTKTMGTGGD